MSGQLTCSGKAFDLLLTFDLYVVGPFWHQSGVYIVRTHNVLQSGERGETGYRRWLILLSQGVRDQTAIKIML